MLPIQITGVLRFLTVEPFLFLTFFAQIMRLVSYQDLLMDRACRNTFGYPDEICDNITFYKKEQAESIEVGNNFYTGVLLLTSLPAVVVMIFIGPWSDKYSRKWPLIIFSAGMLAESVATTFLAIYPHVPPIYFMFVSLLAGVTGGFRLALSSSASYLSDVTNPESRESRFAVFEFSILAANIFGNVAGGQIYKAQSHLLVIGMAPCFYLCALLYVIFYLKETKPPIDKSQLKKTVKDLFSFENLKQSYRTCMKKRSGYLRMQIWLLLWIDTSFEVVQSGTIGILFPFAKKMYNMDVTEFSNANIIFTSVMALMTIAMTPLLSKKFMLHDATIGLIGVFSTLAKFSLLSVSHSVPLFYVAMIIGSLTNNITISVRSRLSKLVPKEELGRAFSLLDTFTTIAPMLGSTIFFQIYNLSMLTLPGLAYIVAVIFVSPCIFIFIWIMRLPTDFLGDKEKESDLNGKEVDPKIITKELESVLSGKELELSFIERELKSKLCAKELESKLDGKELEGTVQSVFVRRKSSTKIIAVTPE